MSETTSEGHPVGPEVDDSQNPISAAPEEDGTYAAGGDGEAQRASRDMLHQLQHMIDSLATQAGPVMREVGAKAAELAALAGEKAGPLAHRAASATERVGVKVAERSKVMATELRRQAAEPGASAAGGTAAEPGAPAAEPGTAAEPATAAEAGTGTEPETAAEPRQE